jgi:outer membrane protein OmpA-like peptidoglycan-associated protein
MKAKDIFLTVSFITILLILLCVFIHNQNNRDNRVVETPSPLIFPKVIDKIQLKIKTVEELEKEINKILTEEPIVSLDANKSNKTLDKIVSIIKETNRNIVIKIISYSDINSSRSYNRAITQQRSDAIAEYIKERHNVRFIYSIGYGKEFLSKENNKTDNRIYTKIYLRRIKNDF